MSFLPQLLKETSNTLIPGERGGQEMSSAHLPLLSKEHQQRAGSMGMFCLIEARPSCYGMRIF